jgi:hypothetical protein
MIGPLEIDMHDVWTCPACGFVARPIKREPNSLSTNLLEFMFEILPASLVNVAWHINRDGYVVCVNCKSNKVVPQSSALGRRIAANHGLKISAASTRSKRA